MSPAFAYFPYVVTARHAPHFASGSRPICDSQLPSTPWPRNGWLSHKITQHPPPSPFSKVSKAARVAASKTSSTPSPDKLEHSKYFRAPISRAATSPSWDVTNRRLFLRISSIDTGSSRRSFFSPTRMMGTPGHRSVASSIHCKDTSESVL